MRRIIKTLKERLNFLGVKVLTKISNETESAIKLAEKAKNTKYKNPIIGKIGIACATAITTFPFFATTTAFAIDSRTSTIDSFIDFACDWLVKIGGVVALVGGVMFAMGWQREDAEGKTRGLMTILAGAMIAALGLGGTTIFNFG